MKVSSKKTNNGRSMLEMLGVLALMAILSLVGVYMLQRSMLVHRTNQLVEDMRLAGMVVLDGLYDDLTTQEMSIKGHFEQQTPYEFAAAMESDTLNTFYVIAKGVPFDVCIEVKNRKPQWAEQIVANDEQDTCLENQGNDMGFFFNDELTDIIHDYCQNDSDCGECGECKNNKCLYGYKNKSGTCFTCHQFADDVEKTECNKCKNLMWRAGFVGVGQCRPRLAQGDHWGAGLSTKECEKFENQYSVGNGMACFYCAGTFNPLTGICNTADCSRFISGRIYGLSETDCIACGGNYRYIEMEQGGKVGQCNKASQ